MSFKCDYRSGSIQCTDEAKYSLEYSFENRESGKPNYVEYRCGRHISCLEGLNHSSCGLPEVVRELEKDVVRKDILKDLIMNYSKK